MMSLPQGCPPLPAKVLSVKPFSAWAIVHGFKDVENRSRRTNYRGRVLIHASGYRSRDELEDDFAHVRKLCPSVPMEVEAGGIIGSVEIYACSRIVNEFPYQTSRWEVKDCEHWWLRKARTLPYFECKGALGIWTLTTHTECFL